MSRSPMLAMPLAVLLACLLVAGPVRAQEPLERQMSSQEFKAAGLDKLSPQELAALNAWLGRKISSETVKAAAEAKRRVEEDNRGFFNFGSMTPVMSTLVGDFRGFAKGRTYTLSNGQVWKQVDEESMLARLSNPGVRVTPSRVGNVWYLKVDRYNTAAKVQRVK
ncbi:MAG TPA: hypothetical protein VNI56_05250 [Xanthomonadaceae bacterium]|nr:hypothetical protein [Xanthomonadaceae bacterium]